MTGILVAGVVALLTAAIAVQLAYLRGFARAGVDVTRATKVVAYFNIALLVLLIVGLVVLALTGRIAALV